MGAISVESRLERVVHDEGARRSAGTSASKTMSKARPTASVSRASWWGRRRPG